MVVQWSFQGIKVLFFWWSVSIILSTPPGSSAVSEGSISREDDGSFWQLVSSLLHDLAGPSRALRHSIPSVAAEEQEGGGEGRGEGEVVSGGAEVISRGRRLLFILSLTLFLKLLLFTGQLMRKSGLFWLS